LLHLANKEERMSQKVNESRTMPAASVLTIPGDSPAAYALSAPMGASLSGAFAKPDTSFVRQRSDTREADRPFLLWCLAGLIIATVTCGAIAMSAVVTIGPVVN
jgi:hypothetical protein